MRVECQPTAWRHGITGDEIRTIITFPLLRYAITTIFPMAETFMLICRVDQQPWIEVAAEDVDGEEWAVFHAMRLTARTAREVFVVSQETIDLRGECSTQRPFIGPQYDKKD